MQALATISIIILATFVFSLKLADKVEEETGSGMLSTAVFLLTFSFFSSWLSLYFLSIVYG